MADDRGSWVPRYLVAIGVTGITTSLMQAVELSTAEMVSSPNLFAGSLRRGWRARRRAYQTRVWAGGS
jgi:hypothetical protein